MVLEALVVFCVYWTAVQAAVVLAALVLHLAGRRRNRQAVRDRRAVEQLIAEVNAIAPGPAPRRVS